MNKLKLSKILAIFSLLCFLGTYFLGNTMSYFGNDEEDNRTFQPFSFFIPKNVDFVKTEGVIKKALGDKLYYYNPKGIKSYLIGFHTAPFWIFDINMIQLPEGAKLYFRLTDLKGAIADINVLNHYVGLSPVETIAPTIRKLIPFIYLIFTLMIIYYILKEDKYDWFFGIIPSLMIIYILIIATYVGFQFSSTFNHHAAYKLETFNPIIIGKIKIKNVELDGYAGFGFYLFLMQMIFMFSSFQLRRMYRIQKELT